MSTQKQSPSVMTISPVVPFTQYLRPDGRKVAAEFECSEQLEALANEFIAAGGYFECEHLTTGHASLTAGYNDEDIAIELVPNGPEVPAAVERLVHKAIKWLRAR
jgi:hypothetical protein